MGNSINNIKFLGRKFFGVRNLNTTPVYDPDAQAYFNANTTITSTADKNAINTFYLGLKSDGIYTKIKAMYLPIWGSAASCKWNLVNPVDTNGAFRLTFTTGWTFSSGGMTPNGLSAYADTFFTPSIDTDGTSHYSFYSRTNVAASAVVFGSNASGPNYFYTFLNPRNLLNQCINAINENTGEVFPNSNSLGLFTLNRQASNDYDVWINSTKQINTTKLSLGRSTFKIYLGALNAAGTANNFSTNQCSFFSAGLPLTDTELTNFYNRVQTLMTYFGINV